MAEEDVITSENEEGQAVESTVTMMRRAKDIVEKAVTDYNTNNNTNIDIEDPTIGAAAFALTDYAQSNPGLMNNAEGLETLEAGIKGIIDNSLSGSADDRMPKIEELLNLVLANADGMFVTAETQAKKKREQQAILSQENAAVTNRILFEATYASLADIEIDPSIYNSMRDSFNRILLPKIEDKLKPDTDTLGDPESSDAEKDDALLNTTKIMIEEALADPEFMEANPDFADMTAEQQAAYMLQLAKDTQIDLLLKDPDHNYTREQAEAIVNESFKRLSQDPETFAKVVSDTEYARGAINALSGVQSGIFNNTQTVELSELALKQAVVSLDYMDQDATYSAVYYGYGQNPDGSLIMEGEGPKQYYWEGLDGNLEEINPMMAIASGSQDGEKFIQQMDAAGIGFDNLPTEAKANLLEISIQDEAAFHNALLNPESNTAAVEAVMAVETFRNSLGPYALEAQIQSQLDDGQLFANDPDLLKHSDVIFSLEQSLNELKTKQEETANYISTNPEMRQFLAPEVEELEASIIATEERLSQYMELNQAVESLTAFKNQIKSDAEKGINSHFSEEKIAEIIAEMETDIERLKHEIIGEELEKIAEADAEMEDSANKMDALQAQHEAMNPDFAMVTPLPGQTLSPEFRVDQEFAYQADQYMAAKEEKETAEETIAQVEAMTGGTETADAPAPAPNSTQALLDENAELKSYLQSLSSQHGISEADLHDELESRGLTSAQAKAVTELAETQYAVNVSPKIDTPVATNTTTAAFKGPGELLQGTFANATKVGSVEVTPTPDGPQIMGPGDNMAVETEIANNDPAVKSTMGL